MSNVTYDFSGQVALVSGAAAGLGLATAKAFAASGAKVALVDIDEGALQAAVKGLREEGREVLGICCDVSDDRQVKEMVEKTVKTFGRLDAAYNNAGIVPRATDFTEILQSDYDRLMAVNLKGVWSAMKYELLQMESQGSGTIVNCSSLAGLVGGYGRPGYHAAKHGVVGLTRSVGMEYAARGIRVNAVCPGTMVTPQVMRMSDSNDLDLELVEKSVPIKRMGRAEEIADAVLWLCSSGSTYVIGQALAVDGGYTTQ
ncbi:SDR family oxidoreductase [Paraburkholderia sp. BR10923]|uniref:SDR family oxidoreductase n=1 Tax=Paraburkholderia sp. BR10923 TaxID=3236992 RepID=UPI0034CFCFB1